MNYLKKYSDSPFLVLLDKTEKGYTAGRFLRASRLARYAGEENGDWKFLVFDTKTGEPRMPRGAIGSRWQAQKGRWNLELKDDLDGTEIDPLLSLLESRDAELSVTFADSANNLTFHRSVPVKYLETAEGRIAVTTVFDLLMAQYGVPRGLPGDYPKDYDDSSAPYTPAWQETFTGIGRNTVIQFAREFASTAEKTEGKCTVIVGSGVNHWYHSNLHYRASHRCPDALRLYRSEWRRAKSLHRPGKTCARGLLVHALPWRSTGRRPPATKWAVLPLCAQRPMAI